LDPKAARFVYDIYKINVSDYYKLKKEHLQGMDLAIRLKEIEAKANKNVSTLAAPRPDTAPGRDNTASARNDFSKPLPTL
jgi:hypothetical protein